VRNNFEGFLYAHLLPKAWCEKLLFAVTFAFWVSFCLVPAALWAAEQSSVPTPSPAGTSADVKASTAHAPLKTTPIVVRFIVNTQPKGDFFAELDEHHHLYITPEDAQTLKLQYAEDKMVIIRQDEQYVPLSALLNVHYTFDEQKLTVTIVGKTTESAKTVADLFSLQAGTKNIYYPRETGAFINYGLNYAFTGEDGFQSFSLTNKVGFRTGDMFFTTDSVYTKTENDDHFVRLQSSLTYERRPDLQWLVLGDQYANSGNLGSTVNMAGIGFSKVYRIDPYFITQPVMNLQGTVIYPTQAEIYLNGVLIGKQDIAPGSFNLKNIYSQTGSHNIEVVLKDPFGNEQRISYMAYFSAQMLREGLHEYSYNIGFLREQYGSKSNEYGDLAFSAFHRYGVTNSLNIGARAEGSDGTYNGGVTTTIAVPRAGQFTLEASGSYSDVNDSGNALSLEHSLQIGSFNTNLLLRKYSRYYATVGTPLPAEDSPRYELRAGMGFTFNPLGSFSFNYAQTEDFKGIDTRVISVNYSRTLYKSISLFATGSATRITNEDTNYSGFIGLNFSLTDKVRGSAQANFGSGDVNSEIVQIQKDMPVGEGLGYRATINRSETSDNTTTSFNPYLQYNARYGIYSVDARIQDSSSGSSETYNLSAAGSAVYVGGFFGLSRPVNDSFGVVLLNKPVPGAAVFNNGEEIGKTGSSGSMIVPTLVSYGQNKMTLDTKNIPLDYSVTDVNKTISPSLWSGCCVYFDVKQLRSLTGHLYVQKEGKKTPLEYVEVSLNVGERKITFPTGKGGEFYVENSLPEDVSTDKAPAADKQSCRTIAQIIKAGGNTIMPGTYKAVAEYGEGKCEFSLTFPDTQEMITEIGEIECVASPNAVLPSVSKPSLVSQSAQAPFDESSVSNHVSQKQDNALSEMPGYFENKRPDRYTTFFCFDAQ